MKVLVHVILKNSMINMNQYQDIKISLFVYFIRHQDIHSILIRSSDVIPPCRATGRNYYYCYYKKNMKAVPALSVSIPRM